MAFPTSSLTNNQVHKEGNRAFVYDSALGVWDQVRETDRTENKFLQGEIASGVTFPSGHIIKHTVKPIKDTVNIITSGTAYHNSGIELIHTTAKSSTDSYMRFDWYSGMTYKSTGTAVVNIDLTMTTASDTTYDVSDSFLESDPSHYVSYVGGGINDAYYHQESATAYIGLQSGMGVPPNKTTWSAAETLYFRLWVKCGAGTYRITHTSSIFSMSITEISR